MIVTLNGRSFDMTLERERTVGELLNGIERWLEQSRFSVSGFKVNGEMVSIERVEEACAKDIDEVQTLEVLASSWSDLFIQALSECGTFLEEAAAERELARNEGRAPNTDGIAERFSQGAAAGFLSGNAADLCDAAASALRGTATDPDTAIKNVQDEIAERINELEFPMAELKRLRGLMSAIADRLEEVPLELQTGKDAHAAAALRDLAALMSKLLRLVPIVKYSGIEIDSLMIGEYSFSDFFDELKTALKELAAAYENGDAILVGDLAEYELAPRLRSLASGFAEITDN